MVLWLLLLLVGLPAWAEAPDSPQDLQQECAPRVLRTEAAPAEGPSNARPAAGWEEVTLPDMWARRWPHHDGSAWYRIDWERTCAAGTGGTASAPLALGIDGISVAGEVYINDDLLWRDASLAEPLSRSWNVPRWWLLPESALREGVNTVWVRAVGMPALSPGMGALRLGSATAVSEKYRQALWRQRTVYFINAVLCAMASVLFLLIWVLNRQERAYGWFGLMALCWMAYLSTYLAYTQWPWPDSLTRSRFSLVALVFYVLSVCMFTFRFGRQRLPRVERVLWSLAVLGTVMAVLAPREHAGQWFGLVWQGSMAVFLLNCLQFQWHAWRPQRQGRNLQHMTLAVCWLVFAVVAFNSFFSVFDRWQVARDWAALSGVLVIGLLMLLLGGRFARQLRNVRRFNLELRERVEQARAELSQALAREQAQAVEHAKLQERIQLAHDLHDGLGGSLVRSMALVEQSPPTLPSARVLSLLKGLRDDLNQLIDHGSSAAALVPQTPLQWIAPLRHRITRILDEIGIASEWHIAPQWLGALEQDGRPSALQCLLLTRMVEEALSNVIRHSRAHHVWVKVEQPDAEQLCVRIEDDGIGFDLQDVQRAGQSVGMRSMAARAERLGARFTVDSSPGATVVLVELRLQPSDWRPQ
ncbi:histidine kinase [Corticibacter populi]|uniref:Histidine kinase n=1 Tax=Corticibacter populi TaxID=1550736 RepID=A0A3M6QKP3_9BURK|nr:histidine kinase [Corticibacter populi]